MIRRLKIAAGVVLAIPVVMTAGFFFTQLRLSSKDFPVATSAPNWQVLAKEEIPSVVTIDADGERRITQLWIASIDTTAYLRTGATKWFANLERKPELKLRIGGQMYPCRTRVVSDQAEARAVHEAFYAKYPKRSSFFRAIGVSTPTVIALACSPGS